MYLYKWNTVFQKKRYSIFFFKNQNQSDKNQSQSKSGNKTVQQEDKNTCFHQNARVYHFWAKFKKKKSQNMCVY